MQMRLIEPSDLNTLQSWLDYHKQVDVDLSHMPRNGLIVPDVMAMFYTMTDSSIMWVDTLISNPRAELPKRREAGRLFAITVFRIAEQHKINRVFFLTRNKAVEHIYSKMINAKPVGTFTLYKTEYSW